MVDKFRIGGVARALSGGLDLFIGREAEKEREASQRAWDLKLEGIRNQRQEARDDKEFHRQLALNAQRNAVEGQRMEASEKRADERSRLDRQARAAEGTQNRGARREEFFHEMVNSRRTELQRAMLELKKQEDEALENKFLREERDSIKLAFEEERDTLRGSFAMSMMDEARRNPDIDAFAPYRVRNKEDLHSVLQGTGMTAKAARTAAEDMIKWQLAPGDLGGAAAPKAPDLGVPPHIPDPENPGRKISNPAYMKLASDRDRQRRANAYKPEPTAPVTPAQAIDASHGYSTGQNRSLSSQDWDRMTDTLKRMPVNSLFDG